MSKGNYSASCAMAFAPGTLDEIRSFADDLVANNPTSTDLRYAIDGEATLLRVLLPMAFDEATCVVGFDVLEGPRLADGSWSRPCPVETAMHEALDRGLDAIWGPT